jgi:HK97 family phage major capsid protein
MNKKMRELLQAKEQKKAEMRAFLDKKDIENAEKVKGEIAALNKEYDLEETLYNDEISNIENQAKQNKELTANDLKALEVKAFAKAIAKVPMNDNEIKALSSLSGPEGGYLIPQDIQTRINELQRQYVSLRSLVTVQPVTTVEGSRVIEEDASSTPFVDISELTAIPNVNGPGFGKVSYKIRDLGGILTIPNHLLDDETGGLVNYIAEWFTKKQYATDNSLILNADGSKGSQGILGLAGTANGFTLETLSSTLTFKKLKSILNKGFPTPIAKKANIVTNQDGLDILDNMEDQNGRPYLTGDGTQEFPYRFKGRKVEVYDNDVLPNVTIGDTTPTDHAPFIIGDLKSAMVLWDRKQMEVASSKEAGFTNNSTLMRAIIRLDTRIWDKKACMVVYSPLLTV